jgi:hypothetical protein
MSRRATLLNLLQYSIHEIQDFHRQPSSIPSKRERELMPVAEMKKRLYKNGSDDMIVRQSQCHDDEDGIAAAGLLPQRKSSFPLSSRTTCSQQRGAFRSIRRGSPTLGGSARATFRRLWRAPTFLGGSPQARRSSKDHGNADACRVHETGHG